MTATEQPDWASEEHQIELLARDIAHMPHPGRPDELDVPIPAGSRRPFAERLYRKGHRVFPELAQVETVTVGEEQMGAYAPSRTVPLDDAFLWKLLLQKDPALYERIKAATSDDELAAIAAEIGPKAGHAIGKIMATFEHIRGAGLQ
jgi:hypothetical protein